MSEEISKTRPNNLDFVLGVSNIEQYFIPSLVLVQSILENNLWANQIQISIFYENWSPEQKKAYEQLIDNFNQSQGKNFAILKFFDVSKSQLETYVPYHGFNGSFRIEGLKFIKPISNWIFSIDTNVMNIRSLKPLISKLNQDFLNCWAIRLYWPPLLNVLDGSYYEPFYGVLYIFNSKYLNQENGIVKKYEAISQRIKDTYPDIPLSNFDLYCYDRHLGMALQNEPKGTMETVSVSPTSLNQVSDSIYFLKWPSDILSPWHQQFPNNSLKKLWLEYASKNPMSKNFQISFPNNNIIKPSKFSENFKFKVLFMEVFRSSFHLIGKISPKSYQKLYTFYLKNISKG